MHEPAESELDETLQGPATFLNARLVAGFDSPAELVESVDEIYLEDVPDGEALRRLVESMVAKRRAIEAKWTAESDYDRLQEAFDRLSANAIVARMDFTCCQNCGAGEINDEAGEDDRGYTFFHAQDSETIEGGYVYLAYGSFDENQTSSVAIGNEIAETIRAAGLTVEWNGQARQRVEVKLPDWRKPMPE